MTNQVFKVRVKCYQDNCDFETPWVATWGATPPDMNLTYTLSRCNDHSTTHKGHPVQIETKGMDE